MERVLGIRLLRVDYCKKSLISQNDVENLTPALIKVQGVPHSPHSTRPSHDYLDFRP